MPPWETANFREWLKSIYQLQTDINIVTWLRRNYGLSNATINEITNYTLPTNGTQQQQSSEDTEQEDLDPSIYGLPGFINGTKLDELR